MSIRPIARNVNAVRYVWQKCCGTAHYIGSLLRTLRRAARTPATDLTAAESASTLFRFFRSSHVADLKLIATLAALGFLVHCAFVLIFVVLLGPIYHLCRHVVRHLEHLIAQPLPAAVDGNALLSRAGHGVEVLFAMLDRTVNVLASQILPTLVTYVGPVIPICGGIIAWAYLSAATRLGVVDLFACEIRTLCRVSTAFDIGKYYVAMHEGGRIENTPTRSAGSSSQEEYFQVFSSNSHDLEALEALVVGNITEFYTYMKATRDLQRKLADATAPDAQKGIIAHIIFVLYLGFESGRKAVKELIEFEPTQAESILIVMLTEIVCFRFLCSHFQNDELRFARLTLRLRDYETEVHGLIVMVDAHRDDEMEWAPAMRTLPELIDRYNDMLKELRDLGLEQALAMSMIEKRSNKMVTVKRPVHDTREGYPVATAAM